MHKKWLNALSNTTKISKIRTLGSIAAFDINNNDLEYGSEKVEKLKKEVFGKRPFIKANWKNRLFDAPILY